MPGRYPSWCLPQLDENNCTHHSYLEIIGLGASPKDVTLTGPAADHDPATICTRANHLNSLRLSNLTLAGLSERGLIWLRSACILEAHRVLFLNKDAHVPAVVDENENFFSRGTYAFHLWFVERACARCIHALAHTFSITQTDK